MKFSVTKQKPFWWSLSGLFILASLIAMIVSWQQFHSPLRPGLDFIGGTRLQLERDCTRPQNCSQPIDLAQVRGVLGKVGLADSSIQLLGTDGQAMVIRTLALTSE